MCGEVQVPEHHLEVCVIIRKKIIWPLYRNVSIFYSPAEYVMLRENSVALWAKEPAQALKTQISFSMCQPWILVMLIHWVEHLPSTSIRNVAVSSNRTLPERYDRCLRCTLSARSFSWSVSSICFKTVFALRPKGKSKENRAGYTAYKNCDNDGYNNRGSCLLMWIGNATVL